MKEIFLRKELAIGIIFLFFAASVSPVLGASLTTPKEISEGNDLIEIEDESSEMMTVTKVKLLENGFIRSFQDKMSVKDYNEYVEKISACENLEDTFSLLKEYEIIPSSMSLDLFENKIKNSLSKLVLLKKILNRFYGKESTRGIIECFFSSYSIHFNPPVTNFFIPATYFRAFSPGGYGTACGQQFNCNCHLEIIMIFFIGIINIIPFYDPMGGNLAGFAMYIIVICHV